MRPGKRWRHLLTRRDIVDFIAILPDWNELDRGSNAIFPARHMHAMGWDETGVVHVSA